MRWEPDMIARAAAMWKEGLSYTQIAEKLGCTRGAVSGVTNRHPDKFPLRKQALRMAKRIADKSPASCRSAALALGRAGKTGAAKLPAAPVSVSIAPRAATPANLPATLPIRYLDALFDDRCLFFVGDPFCSDGPDMPVCGAERAEGVRDARYCRRHLAGQFRAVAA